MFEESAKLRKDTTKETFSSLKCLRFVHKHTTDENDENNQFWIELLNDINIVDESDADSDIRRNNILVPNIMPVGLYISCDHVNRWLKNLKV